MLFSIIRLIICVGCSCLKIVYLNSRLFSRYSVVLFSIVSVVFLWVWFIGCVSMNLLVMVLMMMLVISIMWM